MVSQTRAIVPAVDLTMQYRWRNRLLIALFNAEILALSQSTVNSIVNPRDITNWAFFDAI